jgi:hypothetical protein
MVALNQNAVKSFFGFQSEKYLTGFPSLLLYTIPKRLSIGRMVNELRSFLHDYTPVFI